MSNFNEALLSYYLANGAVSKNITMAEQEALLAAGSSRGDWYTYLVGVEGLAPGNINDMMYKYLGDKGYTGNLNDRLLQAVLADDLLGGPAWTPAELPGIVDYGIWSDKSRLLNAAGTGPVTTAGDPVRRWTGQLGVVYYENLSTPTMPLYLADGIRLGGIDLDGANKGATSPYLPDTTLPVGFAFAAIQFSAGTPVETNMTITATGGNPRGLQWTLVAPTTLVVAIRNSFTVPSVPDLTGVSRVRGIVSSDGSSGAYWFNGTKATATVGGDSTANAEHHLGSGGLAVSHKIRAWVHLSQELSDENAALLDAWLETI